MLTGNCNYRLAMMAYEAAFCTANPVSSFGHALQVAARMKRSLHGMAGTCHPQGVDL